jgi:hypothetical protein
MFSSEFKLIISYVKLSIARTINVGRAFKIPINMKHVSPLFSSTISSLEKFNSTHMNTYSTPQSVTMYQSLLKLFTLALIPLSTLSSPVQNHPAQLPLPAKTIFQLGPDTWIENIAVRSNNDLLLTVLTTPDLYTFTPSSPNSQKLLHTFPNATSLLGITETTPDTFVLIAGNYTAATHTSIPHTYAIWRVDFNTVSPTITKITDIPEAIFFNGITTLPSCPDKVLIADSILGAMFSLDTSTGEYDIAIQIPEMAYSPTGFVKIGINGLHVHGSYLYFTNSFVGLYRILIDAEGTVLPGAKAEFLGIGSAGFLDDFTLDGKGNAWVMTDLDDTVLVFGVDGKTETVVGRYVKSYP